MKRKASEKLGDGNAQAAKAAISILGIHAFYHHSNISEAIFQSAAEESGKYIVDKKWLKSFLMQLIHWIIPCLP